jgi:hypothetical protein
LDEIWITSNILFVKRGKSTCSDKNRRKVVDIVI